MEKSHNCGVCNKQFTPKNRSHIYCSIDCRNKVMIERYRFKKIEKGMGRFMIFERDGFKCVYCGSSSVVDGVRLTVDHLYPSSKGGKSVLENLVTCCASCNSQKSNGIIHKEAMVTICGEIIKRNNDKFTYEDHLLIIEDLRRKTAYFKDDYKRKV